MGVCKLKIARNHRSIWKYWIVASRPRTLSAAVIPVLVGSALAIYSDSFKPLAFVAALLASLFIQIGTNFANDLHDFKKGADTPERVGPTRVTSAGLLTASQVEAGMYLTFGLAAICGLYLVYVGGWPILIVGIASIAAGIAYTAGPFPLGYNGLGDLAVFVFFGLAGVIGTYYVQTQTVPAIAVISAVAVGGLTTNIIVVNNIRDLKTDRSVGKKTLAVVVGRKGAQIEFLFFLALAFSVPIVLWTFLELPVWVLLPLLTIPSGLKLFADLVKFNGPALNKVLGGTANYLAYYGILFSIGLLIS